MTNFPQNEPFCELTYRFIGACRRSFFIVLLESFKDIVSTNHMNGLGESSLFLQVAKHSKRLSISTKAFMINKRRWNQIGLNRREVEQAKRSETLNASHSKRKWNGQDKIGPQSHMTLVDWASRVLWKWSSIENRAGNQPCFGVATVCDKLWDKFWTAKIQPRREKIRVLARWTQTRAGRPGVLDLGLAWCLPNSCGCIRWNHWLLTLPKKKVDLPVHSHDSSTLFQGSWGWKLFTKKFISQVLGRTRANELATSTKCVRPRSSVVRTFTRN